jgi:chromosome segregation ATPase
METIVNLREKANLSISEKNSEVNALRSHLDTAQSKWEVHQAEMSQKMQQLEEQKQAVEAELNKTKSHSAQTIQSLQDLLQSRENDLQSANVTITELRSKWATTDITHNHLKSEYESCNALLSKAQTSLLEYQGEYQKVEKAFNERSSECDELRQQLATVTEDLRLAQDVTKDLKREQEYFNDKIRLMELTITAQSNEIETLQKDLTRVEKAKEMMEQSTSKHAIAQAQTVTTLQAQCVALRSEFEGVCASTRSESSAMATMVTSALTEGKEALHSLLTTVESKDGEIARLSESVRSLKEKEAALLIELERQAKEYETTSRIHTEEKEALQHLLVAAQERKTSVESTLVAVQEALQALQEKYQQARQDGKAKDDDIASLRRQVTAFDQLVNTLKESAREEIYSQKEQLESTIEIYIGQLKMHETDMLAQATKLREAQEEVRQLRERISTKEQEAQQLHGMVEALKGSLQEEMDQKRQLQSEMDAYVASKASEWTAVEESLSRELEQSKRKCEELDAVRCLLEDQMQSQKDDYATALTAKDEELQTMHSRLAELQATATAKAQAIETLQLELAATRSALAELRLERESSELKTMMQKNDLETKLSETRSALQQATDQHQMLSTELEVYLFVAHMWQV